MNLSWLISHGLFPPTWKRVADNTAALVASTSAQIALIYNTYTSDTVYERGFMRWVSNVLEIGTEHVGGTLRNVVIICNNLTIRTAGTNRLNFTSTSMSPATDGGYSLGAASTRYLRTHLIPTAFASLPSAATAGAGAIACCSDCNSTTYNATAAGGGANNVLVHSDGTNWKVG